MSNLKNENISIYPFLKWAGSKRLLLPELIKHVPLKFNKYYEPFLGGGALFFFIKPKRAFLSDTNAELINTYLQVRNNLNKLISCLKEMKFSKKEYMRIRALQTQDKIERAARFIFLNKTCWNGLYRVNMSGKFNVPVGSSKNPTIFCLDNLLAVSKVLKNADLRVCDFEEALGATSHGDFVFLDPPYVTGHNNNGFIGYNAKLFAWADQERLARVAARLVVNDVTVIVTNAAHEPIRQLYSGFSVNVCSRKNTIASESLARKPFQEFIFKGGMI